MTRYIKLVPSGNPSGAYAPAPSINRTLFLIIVRSYEIYFLILPRHQIVYGIRQLPQIADLQHVTTQRRVFLHVTVTVPHDRRFGIQPNSPRGSAGHGGENICARIIVVVASITGDEKRAAHRKAIFRQ